MNWMRALIAGLVGGVALNISDFVLHGLVMGKTYAKYEVFTKEQANPLMFLLIAICIALPAALLFAKTRGVWAGGAKGGMTYGLWLGIVYFFTPFYSPLVIAGFPYYLSWCWGGINVIGFLVMGAALGLVYKSS